MSDSVQIIIAVCSCITAIGVPLIALLMKMLNTKQDEAAKAVEKVKDVLVARTNDTDKQLQQIHILCNSQMGSQLLIAWAALEKVWESDKSRINRAAADEAKRLYEEHVTKQKIVDEQAKQAEEKHEPKGGNENP